MSAKRKIVIWVSEEGLKEFDKAMKEYIQSEEFKKHLEEKFSTKKKRK